MQRLKPNNKYMYIHMYSVFLLLFQQRRVDIAKSANNPDKVCYLKVCGNALIPHACKSNHLPELALSDCNKNRLPFVVFIGTLRAGTSAWLWHNTYGHHCMSHIYKVSKRTNKKSVAYRKRIVNKVNSLKIQW